MCGTDTSPLLNSFPLLLEVSLILEYGRAHIREGEREMNGTSLLNDKMNLTGRFRSKHSEALYRETRALWLAKAERDLKTTELSSFIVVIVGSTGSLKN